MKKTILNCTCLTVLIFALVGCSSKSDKMVGRWSWDDGSRTEYLENGTFASSEGWSGKWTIDGDILTINGPFGVNASFQILELTATRAKLRTLGSDKELVGTRQK